MKAVAARIKERGQRENLDMKLCEGGWSSVTEVFDMGSLGNSVDIS